MYAHGFRATLFGLAVLATATLPARPAAAQAAVPVKLTLVVAGRTETVRGSGRCGYEPRAYIYGRPAALWSVDYNAPSRSVSLSFWRMASAGGGDQFTLSVSGGRTQHLINTVQGSPAKGSGRATIRPTALGGQFHIHGTAADGTALDVTFECSRFGGIYAEGG